MSAKSTSYQALLLAKEFAGRERAAGAVGFGSGSFTLATYEWFAGLQDKQTYLLDRAVAFASTEEKALFRKARGSAAARRLGELRAVATRSVESGDVEGIDGPSWFKASTAWLGELKAVEGAMAASFVASAEATSSAAHTRFLIVVSVMLISIVAVGGWGAATLRSMIQAMRGVAAAIRGIEAGNDNIVVPAGERGDEIGVIARSLATIAGSGAEAARVRAAVAGSDTPTLVLDSSARRVFANDAFGALSKSRPDALARLSHGDDFSPLCAILDEAPGAALGRVEKEFESSDAILRCRASVVRDAEGQPIGRAVELTDMTLRRTVERRVAEMIDAVAQGDLSKRIQVEDTSSFEGVAAVGMNRICEIVGGVVDRFDESFAALAKGDLSCSVALGAGGRYDALAGNANTAIAQIGRVAREVRVSETALREEISAMRSAAVMLAEKVESQAAFLQETSSTMEQMSRNVAMNATSAKEASQSSSTAGERTTCGRDVVAKAVGSMERIEDASGQISEIVSVIDGIAFQTNLLALNAAVEAARAGEAGKGFAIVAAEVRTLSQRVGDAACDIKRLIDKTVVTVTEGAGMVRAADSSLDEIKTSISDTSRRIAEISLAGEEQATGVSEISQAVAALDDATQQNAVVAETIAQASRSIEEQSDALSALVAFFSGVTEEGGPVERQAA